MSGSFFDCFAYFTFFFEIFEKKILQNESPRSERVGLEYGGSKNYPEPEPLFLAI
jgi:hypothetical protein